MQQRPPNLTVSDALGYTSLEHGSEEAHFFLRQHPPPFVHQAPGGQRPQGHERLCVGAEHRLVAEHPDGLLDLLLVLLRNCKAFVAEMMAGLGAEAREEEHASTTCLVKENMGGCLTRESDK